MKSTPVLFSPAMVLAHLRSHNPKTQTRRIIKDPPQTTFSPIKCDWYNPGSVDVRNCKTGKRRSFSAACDRFEATILPA